METRSVRLAGADGVGHGVVDGEDGFFGDVGAGLGDFAGLVFDFGAGDVFAADDGKGVEDVGGVVAVEAVEVEEGGGEFRAEQEATLLVPAERRPVVAAVPRERLTIP